MSVFKIIIRISNNENYDIQLKKYHLENQLFSYQCQQGYQRGLDMHNITEFEVHSRLSVPFECIKAFYIYALHVYLYAFYLLYVMLKKLFI